MSSADAPQSNGLPFTTELRALLTEGDHRPARDVHQITQNVRASCKRSPMRSPADHLLRDMFTDLRDHADAMAESTPRRKELIDAELVCRFVILGVADCGWTPERFRDLDRNSDENNTGGRGSHKRERISNK